MKCIKNIQTGVVVRTTDKIAKRLTDKYDHIHYTDKSKWKSSGRKYLTRETYFHEKMWEVN